MQIGSSLSVGEEKIQSAGTLKAPKCVRTMYFAIFQDGQHCTWHRSWSLKISPCGVASDDVLHIPFPLPSWDSLMIRTRLLEDAACHRQGENICHYLCALFPPSSYCCVLSSGFPKSAWTFQGICMKLLPNAVAAFVGPVRKGLELAHMCHLQQIQALPSTAGV